MDSLLYKCEPIIINVSRGAPGRFRDEIRQYMRIQIWKYLEKKYDYKKPIEEFICGQNNRLIYKIYRACFVNIIIKYCRYYKKHSVLKDETCLVSEDSVYDFNNIQHRSTLKKLVKCLTEDEKFMIEYILQNSSKGINYDQLGRQWGYSGKGGVRYVLDNIFGKMRKYAKNEKIKVDFSRK